MTKLLDQAFRACAGLPEAEQDRLGRVLLDLMADITYASTDTPRPLQVLERFLKVTEAETACSQVRESHPAQP